MEMIAIKENQLMKISKWAQTRYLSKTTYIKASNSELETNYSNSILWKLFEIWFYQT